MHRRQFLAAAGATFSAGCSGLFRSDSEESTETVTPAPVEPVTETSRRPSQDTGDQDRPPAIEGGQVVDLRTGARTLAIPGVKRGFTGSPVSLESPDGGTVHVGFTETATVDHPATIHATLVNENDWGNRFRLEDVPAFDGANHARLRYSEFDRRFDREVSGDDQPVRYLTPTADHDLVDDDPAIERGPEGYWRVGSSPPELPDVVTLGAGDFVTGEYYVLGRWDQAGLPVGTYDFGDSNERFGLVAWDTAAPGPTATSRFVGSVESLPNDDDTPWYHEADASTAIFLQPDRERVDLPGQISFRLVNHTGRSLPGNPYFWELYKRVDGEWHEVVPRGVPASINLVTPGETYGYSLSLFDGPGFESDDEHANLGESVGRLGGGRYAFACGFSDESSRHADAPAAMFDVDAPTVSLSVPDRATQYQVDDRAVVTLSEWGDTDTRDAALMLWRIAGDADETVIRERVTRDSMRVLESALAVIDDADSVVVRADERLVGNVVRVNSSRRFAFDGVTYLVTGHVGR